MTSEDSKMSGNRIR